MNWYKIAQSYNEVIEYKGYGEYEDDPKTFEAELYFSIGQNEETIHDSFCWMWINGQLHVAKGPTSHNASFGHIGNIFDNYRGYYDPTQNIVSVVVPQNAVRQGFCGEECLPSILKRVLRRKFGEEFEFKVF